MTPAVSKLPVQQARAIGVIAQRLREGAWNRESDGARRMTARRLLAVRVRVNRAGLLRWRRCRP